MNVGISIMAGAMVCAGLGFSSQAKFVRNPDDDTWTPLAPKRPRPATPEYREAVRRTADMAQNNEISQLVGTRGLNLMNLTWEDTGRFKGSAVGPNISDMTIQVELKNEGRQASEIRCMPVIRYPNFSDKTCDIETRDFTLLVGNQRGGPLRRVSLYDFLCDPTSFLTHPNSWRGSHRTLVAPRDEKVLVSAQACFLPIPKQGKATFNPVLFNYQSVSGDPGVLTILATREGTSTTVIDNKRDGFSEGAAWGQRLFHNANGQRTSLTGERLSDYKAASGEIDRMPSDKDQGLGMVLLIQVPLKQHHPMRAFGGGGGAEMSMAKSAAPVAGIRAQSDVEQAVVGHGSSEGEFTEIDNLNIERDPNFPIRVTVQFYKATSNGIATSQDIEKIKDQIDDVYAHSDSVGSLVVDGETGRPTEYVGCKVQPAGWWNEFWQRYEENTGIDRRSAIVNLRRLLGGDYEQRPVSELYLRGVLRSK